MRPLRRDCLADGGMASEVNGLRGGSDNARVMYRGVARALGLALGGGDPGRPWLGRRGRRTRGR